MSKPLWETFVEMTREQVATQQAAEMAAMRAGTMPVAEAEERAEAWRRAGEYQQRRADALEAGAALKSLAFALSDAGQKY